MTLVRPWGGVTFLGGGLDVNPPTPVHGEYSNLNDEAVAQTTRQLQVVICWGGAGQSLAFNTIAKQLVVVWGQDNNFNIYLL